MIKSKTEDCKVKTYQKSDFSIDHILNRAGNNRNATFKQMEQFSWLSCTRYSPPKLPRNSRREGPQKRQLGRHPRIPFSSTQLAILEEKFRQSPYLSSTEVTQLSHMLNLADIRVKIWFQNRRARERREKNDTEISVKKECKKIEPVTKLDQLAEFSKVKTMQDCYPHLLDEIPHEPQLDFRNLAKYFNPESS